MEKRAARKIKISGIVQGVGFRPAVYKLSTELNLCGWVLNSSEGVTIHWEGDCQTIYTALEKLLNKPPARAEITDYQMLDAVVENYSGFFILESHNSLKKKALISPDIGVCSDCLSELLDKNDRRFEYPFINCTNCGPRFTIIKNIPYDRQSTTMSEFSMCLDCKSEYDNPLDRRFHAQPNACKVCGPSVKVCKESEKTYVNFDPSSIRQHLLDGKILAVKGLGGFHLVCDVLNKEAVAKLRKRKLRDKKPFALMAADLATVRKYCFLSAYEEEQLISPARPIVILKQKPDIKLPEEINQGLDTLGIMLPYTPLHKLLFSDELKILVVTSANLSSNPLIISNQVAIKKLKGIADYFLLHDRVIANPCDDSVGHVINDKWQPIRRARGYVPLPIKIKEKRLKQILATGGDLKAVFALSKDNKVFLSQHLGDLDNYLNMEVYKKTVYKMFDLLDIKPELIVHDLHPNYKNTLYAQEIAKKLSLHTIGVQHHHAHMASCMAENGLNKKVLAVICDGTGYGTDGSIWGFEFLFGDYGYFQRLGRLKPVPLLGGEISIRKPSRMAYSFLVDALGDIGKKYTGQYLKDLSNKELEVLDIQYKRKLNTVLTSSCGRLFDAVSALLGICTEQEYEGQAPMELEAIANSSGKRNSFYRLTVKQDQELVEISTEDMWEEIIYDLSKRTAKGEMAYKFHRGIAETIKKVLLILANQKGMKDIVLSGGVFQNRLLTKILLEILQEDSFNVYLHKQVPANDGGLSLGQVLIGNEVYKNVPCCSF
jgi:hydrogenase maturation protein HypF